MPGSEHTFSKELLTFVGQNHALEIASELESLLVSIKEINLDQVLNPGFIARVWTAVLSELSLRESGFEELTLKITKFTGFLQESKKRLVSEYESLKLLKLSILQSLETPEQSEDLQLQVLLTKQSLIQVGHLQDLNLELSSRITQTLEETLPLWKSLILTIMKERKVKELGQAINPAGGKLRSSVGEALKAYHECLEKKKTIDQELLSIEQRLLLTSR